MSTTLTHAEELMLGDSSHIVDIASRLISPRSNNFVERPWGGMRMRAYKQMCELPGQVGATGLGLGEAFELAAYDADGEARAHPSRIRLGDGSEVSLPALLDRHAEVLLGAPFTARYGRSYPLLPKTLDVMELLSVQGHPAGNVEVYIIIDAEPGATIRLGFSENIDAAAFKRELERGLDQQRRLVDLLAPDADLNLLQQLCATWFADRDSPHGPEAWLPDALISARQREDASELLADLKGLYWDVLDRMNAVPVSPGQVIYNATPSRIAAHSGRPVGAEVHALGNPERREILALEIRRPGPTFRAWDNVRFPIRPVDVPAALASLNLERSDPGEFLVEPRALGGGVFESVSSEFFTIEHLRPDASLAIEVSAQSPHSLHALSGAASITRLDGTEIGRLSRGESAIVPIGVGAYRVSASADDTEIVKVQLPVGD